MADTTIMECKTCNEEMDCINGECENCVNGIYFCPCNQEISEHEMLTTGVCQKCL